MWLCYGFHSMPQAKPQCPSYLQHSFANLFTTHVSYPSQTLPIHHHSLENAYTQISMILEIYNARWMI